MPISEVCNRELVIIRAENGGFEAARLCGNIISAMIYGSD